MLYREQDAKVYVRVSDIMINHPVEGSGLLPNIRFNEQYAVVDAVTGEVIPQGPAGQCGMDFGPENSATPFDLLHPETGEVIGSATYQDLQLMLFSMYFHAANLRDNEEPAEPIGGGIDLGDIPT